MYFIKSYKLFVMLLLNTILELMDSSSAIWKSRAMPYKTTGHELIIIEFLACEEQKSPNLL